MPGPTEDKLGGAAWGSEGQFVLNPYASYFILYLSEKKASTDHQNLQIANLSLGTLSLTSHLLPI